MKRIQLESLLRCLARGEKDGVIDSIRRAAASEHSKNPSWANSLEGFASQIERRSPYDQKFLTLLKPSGPRMPKLDCFEQRVPIRELKEVILPENIKNDVEMFFAAQDAKDQLAEHELVPPSRIILTGNPGTGKTLLAEAIAQRTGKEFFIMRMGRLIQSHLGETISNIENSFAAIAQHDAVYLFDEFDAIATSRSDRQDINEMRRALNALLIEFENHKGPSIIVAASNRPDVIDTAFRRRFDYVWEMSDPTTMGRRTIIQRVLAKHKVDHTIEQIHEIQNILGELSFDECEDITRKLVIRSIVTKKSIDTQFISETARHIIGEKKPSN